jgi:hypothetical protein
LEVAAAALSSGIQSGDVVTNVYTLDRSLADSYNPQGMIVRKYDLRKITMEEREDLFFQKYTKLSLITAFQRHHGICKKMALDG